MSEQEERLPSSSSSSSEIYSTMWAILSGSPSLNSIPTRQVLNILKECLMEARRRLHRMEIELAKLKQELNDERKRREHAEALVNGLQKLICTEAELEATRRLLEKEREIFNRIQSEASERQKEAVIAQKTSLQELDKERQARSHAEVYAREVAAKAQEEVIEAIKQASLSIQKLSAAEAEVEATRRALAEERERCEQIKSEAFEKQREAVVAQQTSFQELARVEASAREAARKAQEEIAEAMENARRATENLSATEFELEASRQALDEERERCKRIQSEATQKLEEAIIAQKTNFKELEDERRARALAEASLREAAAKAQEERDEAVKRANLSTKLLSAAETELEATCRALAEEREHRKTIQSEASKTQNELLRCLENDIKELNDERRERIYAEKCAREAAAKARDEIAEAVRQSSLATQKLVAAEAELEATGQILAEERHRCQKIQFEACEKQKAALLAQRTTFLKQLKAQVDTAEKALHWDTK